MKVAIDARMIQAGSMHGIARYVYQYVMCLASKSVSDKKFYIFVNKGNPLLNKQWPDFIELVIIHSKWISFKEQFELPKVLKELNIDLFHSPSFVAPMVCPSKLLMTIHDLNHLVLSQYYTPLHQMYYKIFVKRCIQKSKFVITVSNFSKKEIVKNLGLPEDKILVTYNGVSPNYVPIEDPVQLKYVQELYELPDQFIFCLSNDKPHKNVHQLVRAYCYSRVTTPLVLASPVNRKLIQLAESFGKKHLIYFSKYIHEQHLPTVYSMTKLFVYPSTYEGFGLPPLEALACGAPVLVSNSTSLPEVVGNNAIFADPYDYTDIARALEEGVNNSLLLKKLKMTGLNHSKKFKWDKLTEQTLDIYDRCMVEEKSSLKIGEPAQ